MIGSLTLSIIAEPEIEVCDDRTNAEYARRRLNGVLEQTLIVRDLHDYIRSFFDMSELQHLLQHPSAGLVGVEAVCAAPGKGRDPLGGRV